MRIRSFVVPALLWVWLCWNLHFEWSLNPQYNYGWSVPLLALLLAWQRWETRPAPSVGETERGTFIGSIAILALLLPLRAVEEANPDWRLLSWMFALLVVAFWLLTIRRIAGANSARHFAFPIAFMLVSVPWLAQVEIVIVQAFTRAVARVAVEIAGWAGLGAYQVGNVIQLRTGFVGVDEACSGVRTLQTAVMVTLFLGELLRLSIRRRVALLVIGCGWVFVCNVIRATTLVMIAGGAGIPTLERWHDAVGWVVLAFGTAGLLLLGWLLRDRAVESPPPHRTEGNSKFIRTTEVVAGCAWLLALFAMTEAWYRVHERRLVSNADWHIAWPAQREQLPIPANVSAMLRFNTASSAAWRDDSGEQWWGFFAQWRPARTSQQLVRSHSPDICLPAIGRTFDGELPPVRLSTAAALLPFRVYQFTQQGKPLFVFVCIQEDRYVPGSETQDARSEWSSRGRLLAAWHGRRNPGQRLLELAVTGADTAQAAEASAAELVRTLVR